MSDSPGLEPSLLNLPSLRVALFHRDVTKVYKILVREGVPQRRIAELVDQSQSEVSEIINGGLAGGLTTCAGSPRPDDPGSCIQTRLHVS